LLLDYLNHKPAHDESLITAYDIFTREQTALILVQHPELAAPDMSEELEKMLETAFADLAPEEMETLEERSKAERSVKVISNCA